MYIHVFAFLWLSRFNQANLGPLFHPNAKFNLLIFRLEDIFFVAVRSIIYPTEIKRVLLNHYIYLEVWNTVSMAKWDIKRPYRQSYISTSELPAAVETYNLIISLYQAMPTYIFLYFLIVLIWQNASWLDFVRVGNYFPVQNRFKSNLRSAFNDLRLKFILYMTSKSQTFDLLHYNSRNFEQNSV